MCLPITGVVQKHGEVHFVHGVTVHILTVVWQVFDYLFTMTVIHVIVVCVNERGFPTAGAYWAAIAVALFLGVPVNDQVW